MYSNFLACHQRRIRAGLTRCATLALIVIFTLGVVHPAVALPAGPEPQASSLNQDGNIVGQSWTGSMGVAETTAQIMERQAQIDKLPQEQLVTLPEKADLTHKTRTSSLTQGPVSGLTQPQGPNTAFSLGTSFDGPSSTSPCGTPPDTMGAVGPTQFIIFLNCNIVSYDKATGTADGVLNTTPNNFFTSVRSSSTSDPHIRYDRLTQRWFLFIIDVTFPNNRVLIAVSDSASITAGTTWHFFYFQSAIGTHTSCLADYPTPGVDANALYIGVNQFCGPSLNLASYAGSDGFVVQKSSVLSTGPIHVTGFASMATTSAGPYTPQGVDNPDPAATEGYFIGVSNASWSELDLIRVSNPGSITPTISSSIAIATANQGIPITQPHKGNTGGANGQLDASDNRLFAAYLRNGRLWTAMDVGVTVSGAVCNGVANTSGATTDAVFWWELQGIATGSTPSVRQSGSICDTSPTNPSFYSYGTIAVNGQGHAAIGYTVAGVNNYTEPGYSVRLASDPLGTLPTSYIFPTGTHPYNPSFDTGAGVGFRRWGDYSYTSVDPCDDMTIWTIQEYASQDNAYGERATRLIAPPPVTPTLASPSSVGGGLSSINVVVTGTSVNGSGFYDTPSSMSSEPCRKHITATVSGGVTVNSITYTDPTHVTLNVSTVVATPGLKTVTITNPDGQSAAAAILQVNNLNSSSTALASMPNPSVFGQSVTFTATVSGTPGTPTGSVAFYEGGALLNSSTLSGGIATYSSSSLAVGMHTITATYSGDGSFNPSTASALAQMVDQANTATALASDSSPSFFGQFVTFTATVSVVAPGAGTPTGSVTFFDDGATLGSGTFAGNAALYATSALTVGTHAITATYSGNSSFFGSVSNVLPFTVNPSHRIYLPIVIR